ncbi:alpha/beta fold hydrolase, partial [Hoyosella subflava]|uniref:alpha/beta fold hydrolase n=1 Tax=Hoyosella subflava TaxID=639313 RepID=UPI00059E3346
MFRLGLLTALLVVATLLPPVAHASTPLTWGPCPTEARAPDAECAEVSVPLDHNAPERSSITISVSRIRATGERRGVLFGNPGGPGTDALGMFSAERGVAFPPALREHFDLVAMQPRGLRWSTPLECDTTAGAFAVGALLRQACDPAYADTITTENTARDLEVVRQALSEDTVHLYGLSYGAALMADYATLFPHHVDKMVLDSGVAPDSRWLNLYTDRVPARMQRLHDLFAWIAQRNDIYGLGATPRAVYQRWSDRIKQESGAPAPVPPPPARPGDTPPQLSPWRDEYLAIDDALTEPIWRTTQYAYPGARPSRLYDFTVFVGLYRSASWPEIADAIRHGTPDTRTDPVPLSMQYVITAITCNENANPPAAHTIPNTAWNYLTGGNRIVAEADVFGSGLLCAGWAPVTQPVPWSGEKLRHPPLVLHQTGDAAAPYAGGQALAATFGARMITVDGGDHGVAIHDLPETDQAITNYLLGGE